MTFEEIQNEVWKPEIEGDSITGVLLSREEHVGTNDSMLYTLEVEKKPLLVWGSTVLDGKMVSVKNGDLVKIEYLGKAEPKPGKNPAKMFKVYIDRKDSD